MDPRRPLILLALGAFACGSPFQEEGRSDGPPIGAVEVEIEARLNVGDTWDPDGYQVTGPGFSIHSDQMLDKVTSPGFPDRMQVRVRVERLAEWCNVAPASQLITIRGADTVPVKFVITCSQLRRPVRFIFHSGGIRSDTTPVAVAVQNFLPSFTVGVDDTTRLMIPVGGGAVSTDIGGPCRRAPSEPTTIEVPYYPADTVSYLITRNCGIIRVQGDLQNGNTPRMMIEVAADSGWTTEVLNALPSAWGTRQSYAGSRIARARRRVNGGTTEWAVTMGGISSATEASRRAWSPTFAGYPTWRRDDTRFDYLLQDSTGVTLWSVDLAGDNTVRLNLPGTLRLGSYEWSPDGSRLAYVTDQGIAIAALDAVAADNILTPTVSLTLSDPRWLPAGDTLIVAGAIDTVGGARNAIWRLDIATGAIFQLTTPPAGQTDGGVDVSSDGRYLAFFRSSIVAPWEDGAPRLMTLSLVDGTLRELDLPGTLQGDPMWAR